MKKLIAGPKVFICDECLGLSNDLIVQEQTAELASLRPEQPASAKVVLDALEASVVGQPACKRALAAALFSHLVRINHRAAPVAVPRVLVVGPRGCGKSALAKAVCAFSPKLPACHADVTRLSETGYVGENVENLLGALLAGVKYPELAWEGVLVLDGLHHLAASRPLQSRDISGAEVQRDLIRVLDGRACEVQPAQRLRHPSRESQTFPCERLLVLATATVDLEGVDASDDATLRRHLVAAGLVDELLSRFDVIVPASRLTEAELGLVVQQLAGRSRGLLETLGGGLTVLPEGGAELARRAATHPDGAFALHAPLARLVERALLSGSYDVRLDADAARRLAQ